MTFLRGAGGAITSTVSTSAATATLAESVLDSVDATAGNRTRTLPTGVATGKQVAIEKSDASSNTVAITGKMRGQANQTITLYDQNEVRVFVSEGNDSWRPLSDHRTRSALDGRYVRGNGQVSTIAVVKQATYDALNPPDPATLYVIDPSGL